MGSCPECMLNCVPASSIIITAYKKTPPSGPRVYTPKIQQSSDDADKPREVNVVNIRKLLRKVLLPIFLSRKTGSLNQLLHPFQRSAKGRSRHGDQLLLQLVIPITTLLISQLMILVLTRVKISYLMLRETHRLLLLPPMKLLLMTRFLLRLDFHLKHRF